MDQKRSGGAALGAAVGAVVALVFALVISTLPAWLFVETAWRAIVFVVVLLAAPPTVWFLQWVAHVARRDVRVVFTWAAAGAMTFDGLAIGFAPGLYGQTGDALAWAAASLLFAFASLVVAGQLMLGRVVPAVTAEPSRA